MVSSVQRNKFNYFTLIHEKKKKTVKFHKSFAKFYVYCIFWFIFPLCTYENFRVNMHIFGTQNAEILTHYCWKNAG